MALAEPLTPSARVERDKSAFADSDVSDAALQIADHVFIVNHWQPRLFGE
jgi:hypothetical protein